MSKLIDLMDTWLDKKHGITRPVIDNRTVGEVNLAFLNDNLTEFEEETIINPMPTQKRFLSNEEKVYIKHTYWSEYENKEKPKIKPISTISMYEFIRSEREQQEFEKRQVETVKIDMTLVKKYNQTVLPVVLERAI